MHRPTHAITATALASIAALSLAGAARAAASPATLAAVAAGAAATTAMPPVSGKGKAGKKAARQRDYKGPKANKKSKSNKRSADRRRNSRKKVVHKNINKTVHKTVIKPRHTTIVHKPSGRIHFSNRHRSGLHHKKDHHDSSLHIGVRIGDGVRIGGSFGFTTRHYSRRGYGYSPGYSRRSYGHSRHRSSYGYRPHHSYCYSPAHSHSHQTHDYYTYAPPRVSTYVSPPRYDDAPVGYAPVYDQPPLVVEEPPAQMTYPAPVLTEGQAWNLLAGGEYAAAQTAFSQAASANPSAAPPKVGYALAAALRGDESTAAWAFRRVFRIAPDGADRAPIDANLRQRIEGLMYRFQDLANTSTGAQAADAWFLTAATSYILGDRGAAADAVRKAIDLGDRSDAARNLHSLVEGAYEAVGAENAVARR